VEVPVPRKLLLEQFHLDVYIPRGLPGAEVDAMRWTLKSAGFRARLRRTVEVVFRCYPAFRKATFDISK
jgi:hypothetical protein